MNTMAHGMYEFIGRAMVTYQFSPFNLNIFIHFIIKPIHMQIGHIFDSNYKCRKYAATIKVQSYQIYLTQYTIGLMLSYSFAPAIRRCCFPFGFSSKFFVLFFSLISLEINREIE